MSTNLLFVCSRNQWRSPTGEEIFRKDDRCRVRSRGVSPKARQRLTSADLDWADVVLVMEKEHRSRIRRQYPDGMGDVEVIILDIPDDYGFMDPELVDLIQGQVEPILEAPSA